MNKQTIVFILFLTIIMGWFSAITPPAQIFELPAHADTSMLFIPKLMAIPLLLFYFYPYIKNLIQNGGSGETPT